MPDALEVGDVQQEAFKEALTRIDDDAEIVRRYVTGDAGGCEILTGDQYGELKERVAKEFQIHASDIFVVGSAKLGFSIAPTKRWQKFDPDKPKPSDVDVAIVSPGLYSDIWTEMAKLASSGPAMAPNNQKAVAWHEFHAAGWIRPDKMPSYRNFKRKDKWFEFFRELTSSRACGVHKINAGLYYSHSFLESYQGKSVQQCRGQ